MTQTSTPPGWYPDPQNPQQQRYWDGMTWTENRAPLAPPAFAPAPAAKTKKPWYRRWWAIAAAVVIVLIVASSALSGGKDTSNGGGSGSASGSSAGNKPAKKSGLDATAGHANPIAAGAGFTLGDFKVLPGWTVKKEGFGLGYSVEGLQVQNTTSSSHTFSVDIKLHQGAHRIAADISCIANEANPKDIVEVDCFPDGSGAKYDSVTIENSF